MGPAGPEAPKERSMPITPFQINVADAGSVDLTERLARTRFPDEGNDAQWSYGTDLASLRELVESWRSSRTSGPSSAHCAARGRA